MKKLKVSIWKFHSQASQPWFQNTFWNYDWTIFLLRNWQNVRYKQTSKQTNKQKSKISISTTRLPTTSQSWFQNSFWNHDWTIFLLRNWQNLRYKQTSKQTNKLKFKISISTTRLPTTSQSWFQNTFWNHDWTIFLLRNWQNVGYIKWEKALYKMRKSEKTTFQWPKVSEFLTT